MLPSLRRRLTVILLGLTLLTWFVSVLATALYANRLMSRQIDEHLVRYSNLAQYSMDAVLADPLVAAYFRDRTVMVLSDVEPTRVTSFVNLDNSYAVNLWFGRSQVLVGQGVPVFPEPMGEGFINWQMEDNSQWRILYEHSPDLDVWRAVGMDLRAARQGGLAAFFLGLLPLFFVLPITLVILFYGIRRGLRPLDELAQQIAARKPLSLQPFELDEVPEEMRPVIVSLNGLLDRLHRALASEQRFTANAAHELQTPLSAIQAALQNFQRQLKGLSGSEQSLSLLERISGRVSGASEMVRQLLTLARLDPDQQFDRQWVELESLIGEVMAEVGEPAMERELTVDFDDSSRTRVLVHVEWLKILLRNLFTNAFRYARAGSEVSVIVDQNRGYARIAIANDCDPIPKAEFERLAERFYHPSVNPSHGAGLGLSIAQRIAELHGAELRLASWHDGRGFIAEIRFPPVLSPFD